MAGVDLNKTLGSNKALKVLGLNKDRLGQATAPAPKIKADEYYSEFTTPGTIQQPKVAALDDAPDYKHASSKATSCANCKAYTRTDSLMGTCDKYDFYARNDYTCNGWKKR